MTLEDFAQQCIQLLQLALEEAHNLNKKADERTAFVYRHAQLIRRLAEDAWHLQTSGRYYSSPIVARSMLESLFNLIAAVENPRFAVEKLIWEAEDEIARIKKWLAPGDAGMFDAWVVEIESLSQSLKGKYNILDTGKWDAFACAEAAKWTDEYRREYFVYSRSVHPTAIGIIGRENQIGGGHVLQTILMTVLHAAAYMVEVVPTKEPKRHTECSAELMRQLTKLIKAGTFSKLDS